MLGDGDSGGGGGGGGDSLLGDGDSGGGGGGGGDSALCDGSELLARTCFTLAFSHRSGFGLSPPLIATSVSGAIEPSSTRPGVSESGRPGGVESGGGVSIGEAERISARTGIGKLIDRWLSWAGVDGDRACSVAGLGEDSAGEEAARFAAAADAMAATACCDVLRVLSDSVGDQLSGAASRSRSGGEGMTIGMPVKREAISDTVAMCDVDRAGGGRLPLGTTWRSTGAGPIAFAIVLVPVSIELPQTF